MSIKKTSFRKTYIHITLVLFQLGCLNGCSPETPNSKSPGPDGSDFVQSGFPDVLDIAGVPSAPDDKDVYCFSDLGAWHGYTLPATTDEEYYGSIIGPYLMSQANGIWQGKSLLRLQIVERPSGNVINLADAKNPIINYLPGKLIQKYRIKDISVIIQLVFLSSRTSLIGIEIENESSMDRELEIRIIGDTWIGGSGISSSEGKVTIDFTGGNELSVLHFDQKHEAETGDNQYEIKLGWYGFAANESRSYVLAHSVTFDQNELQKETDAIATALKDPAEIFKRNEKRWNNYLEAVLSNPRSDWADWGHRHLVTVKSLITLTNNWRSAAGELKHDGLFPSYAYHGFHGFWSWDSWKHAVAIVQFDTWLAKQQVRAMFDYQDEYGMIADCIYRDTLIENHNWRDTKPPLAGWAVKEIYDRTGDLDFVKEMYPKLLRYHTWWYKFRDQDNNGLCEFGSTDGTKTAAMWESGMDNAVRFDDAIVVGNSRTGWSLDQESIDLNAYLFHEKQILAKMAQIIGNTDDQERFETEAIALRQEIRELFYDQATSYFYDRKLDGSLIRTMGPEAWTTLWTGAATAGQAEGVKEKLISPDIFNTHLPFPTLTASSEKFEPAEGYWRGPVWIDQAYFAIEGLRNYGYDKEAMRLSLKLFENMGGLVKKGSPIYENYDPLTGKALNAAHFSWSAAHLIMLMNK